MSRACLILVPAFAMLVGQPEVVAQDKEEAPARPVDDRRDLTLLRRLTEKAYLHDAARVTFTIPDDWKEIRPHRLNRKIDPRISTVLGIERADRETVASIYWIPMNPDQKLSHWVRESLAGSPPEYGEEYETLKAIYGKDHVTKPERFRSGDFDVYRINITGGPDRGDKSGGALFVFAVESGGATWLIKARVSSVKGDRSQSDASALEVIQGFGRPAESGIGTAEAGTDDRKR